MYLKGIGEIDLGRRIIQLTSQMDEKDLISKQRKSAHMKEYKVTLQITIDIPVVAHDEDDAETEAMVELKRMTGSNSSVKVVDVTINK